MKGLSEQVIRQISKKKDEPLWMLDKRLKAYKIFIEKSMPSWGADLSGIDFNSYDYFKEPEVYRKKKWSEVPKKTKEVYEKLGIPEVERKMLSGVGAQWDSGVVYQSLKKKLSDQGVIFCDMDEAVTKYPEMVKKYFMTKVVNASNNKFSALHGAVWSGGSFVYVPKGVKVIEPLQAYFFMNLKSGGQFEHTMIICEEESSLEFIEGCSAPRYAQESLHVGCVEILVGKRAKVRYSTVQNWSKDVYNLPTKRAIVEEGGVMEWISGSLGSRTTMVYPASILVGKGSRADHLNLSLASKGQEIDSGGKAIHVAPETTSNMIAKSISKDGGKATYRGLVKILKGACDSKTNVSCDALILDKESKSHTFPHMEIDEDEVVALHEAKTGKIAEEELTYLMSRGISEAEAMAMIVNGFMEPIVKKLPLEYAVEMNRLIELEMEGSVG
jgi:Fe-S cluster assembly protein SufB